MKLQSRLTSVPTASWRDGFDVLRTEDPELITSLIQQFPEFSDELTGVRIESVKDAAVIPKAGRRAALASRTVTRLADALTSSFEEVLKLTASRLMALARVRLGSGIIALLGSSGVLATLPFSNKALSTVSALIACLASLMMLIFSYLEDESGGPGRLRGIHEKLLEQVGALAEIRGAMALPDPAKNEEQVTLLMSKLAALSGDLQKARASLGLPLMKPTAA